MSDDTRLATGTFTVSITREAQAEAPPYGVPTGRMGLQKTFTGGLEGAANGTMLSAGSPGQGSASYVAIDQFYGKIDGREGGLVLLHQGTMDGMGGRHLAVVVAPGSGTGELAGIGGTLTIDIRDGTHFYELAYTLPAIS